jgi:hypothetical protein
VAVGSSELFVTHHLISPSFPASLSQIREGDVEQTNLLTKIVSLLVPSILVNELRAFNPRRIGLDLLGRVSDTDRREEGPLSLQELERVHLQSLSFKFSS